MNTTINELLAKAPSSGTLEVLTDDDLIKSHIVAKDNLQSSNNLLSTNASKWLPLLENEITYRKGVLEKSKAEVEDPIVVD